MVSKFDSPAQDRYTSTYVPLPYEQIMGTVASRQAQLGREQDMLNKTYEDTQNLKYIPGTKDEQYVRDYLDKTGNIVNKYFGADLSDPIVKQQMRTEFNNITDRQNLQNIETSHANWVANNKIRAQLKATGKYSEYLDEDPSSDPEFSSANGQVYNYTTPQFDSYLPEAQKFWANVKPGLLRDPKTGDFMQTSEGYHLSGYSDPDLKNYSNLNWGTFAETPTGRSWITSEIRSRGLEENDVNRQAIAKELLWNQRPQGGPTLEGSRTPEGSGGGGPDKTFYPTSQEQDVRTDKSFDPYNIGDDIKFKDGQVYVEPKYFAAPTSAGYGAVKGVIPAEEMDVEARKVKESEQKARLAFAREQVPAWKELSDQETFKAYKDVTKDGTAFPELPKTDLSNVARNKLAQYIADSMIDRDLIVMDDKGTSDIRNTRDDTPGSPMRDLGYTVQTLKEELRKAALNQESMVSIGGIVNNGPRAGMLQLEVKDLSKKGAGRKGGKGETRKVYITTNQETEAIMSPLKETYDYVRNFKKGVVPIGKDAGNNTIGVRVTPKVYKNQDTGKWEYSYTLDQGFLTEEGFIYVAPTSMSQLKDMQLKQLMTSGYTNTNIGFTPTGSLGF